MRVYDKVVSRQFKQKTRGIGKVEKIRFYSLAAESFRSEIQKIAKISVEGDEVEAMYSFGLIFKANKTCPIELEEELKQMYLDCVQEAKKCLCLDGKPCDKANISFTPSRKQNKAVCKVCGQLYKRTNETVLAPSGRRVKLNTVDLRKSSNYKTVGAWQ